VPSSTASAGPPVALVGVGAWGVNVLRDLRALGCEVWAVASQSESAERAQAGGAAGVVSSVADLPPVRGAVVCTPVRSHFDVVEEIFAAQDVPVAVEKPMTADVGEAELLASRHDGRLFVLDKWRYHPGVEELARIARSRELGAVVSMHLRRISRGHPVRDVDPVWILLPHDLAIVLEVLGSVPPAVHAVQEECQGGRTGIVATLGGSPWVNLEVSSLGNAHRRELRVVCEDGVAGLDGGWAEEITIMRHIDASAEPEVRAISGELPLLAELRAFVEHLEGGPAPRSSVREGLEMVRRISELAELSRRLIPEGVR
jgi:predicted dehydrogenase